MMDETLHDPGTDAEAVAAVRRGDAERYRELVERHERRVFAVAWSRLGDATLAEEATQEAFIRGYRRLWLLGDGAKFSGWIASVARNVAINLGLRHRRELNKRERWALEHPGPASDHGENPEVDPLHSPEALRQTLAELPTAHRECLVLFYLEGKSGTEAATALGISEAALRVRLHRARAALRERLEEKLESSLGKLRPSKSLVPAIMAGVLASSSAKAATAGGLGATVLGTLTKFTPFKWAFVFFPFLFALPTILFSWLMLRAEAKNFRDAKGFRVRIFREDNLRRMVWMAMMFAIVFLILKGGRVRLENFYIILAGIGVLNCLACWRQVVLNRSRFFRVTFWSATVMCFALCLIGLQVLPAAALNLLILLSALAGISVHRERPIRMDYNIFLRAAAGMLDSAAARRPEANLKKLSSKRDLLAYGRFLGSRWMADSYRWTAEGLRLRLPPVRFSLWNAMGLFNLFSPRSYLLLGYAGNVSPQLCLRDQKSLLALHPHHLPNADELETQVALVAEAAWENFRHGEFGLAERALGQLPEAELFVQPLAQAGFPQWRTRILLVLLVLILGLTGLRWLKPPWLEGMKPVSVTEAQVRDAFANYTADSRRKNSLNNGLSYALSFNFVLPPTSLMSPTTLQAIKGTITKDVGFEADSPNHSNLERLDRFLLALPLANDWFGGVEGGFDRAEVARMQKQHGAYEWQFGVLSLSQRSCHLEGNNFSLAQLDSRAVAQLRWLRDQGSLDFVDRARLVDHTVSLQVLSGAAVGNRPPLKNWRDLRGLFYTPGWSPLKDTYCSLAALDILGALERIDHDACITAILKMHQGKGYFVPPETNEKWSLQIQGDAQDTFCAFESLRILSALDRVKDLDKWQFRVKSAYRSKPDDNGIRTPTWVEIEAWVCQQRLERIIRQRKENPGATIRSLLEH